MPAPSRVAARCWIHTGRPQQTSCQHSAYLLGFPTVPTESSD